MRIMALLIVVTLLILQAVELIGRQIGAADIQRQHEAMAARNERLNVQFEKRKMQAELEQRRKRQCHQHFDTQPPAGN